ncbi:MAG: TRAP transporter substrate-binding protein DctP [Rhodospirillaceae bacterium]|jgi:TRAP-type transport system periplasmic protein|nr:TRAP transporter substrate-binding protein DctP [Rhodospirillaceae bacterium]MBT4589059.1 TRAP transporter substrate-binding protein DctP [Rhodospirillaceae bacterium]MBT5940922.1 TRAP transporter substrate-binding protein DctP [Rhodospirillaceae bacterium]
MSDLSFRFGGYQTPISIHTRAGAALGDGLKERLSGNVDYVLDNDITVFGHKTGDLITLTESGELTFCYMSTNYFSSELPMVSVLDLPFVFNDREKAYAKLDGELGDRIKMAIEAAHPNLKILHFWDNGYRHFSNRVRAIREPKDCEGIRTRTLPSEFQGRIYRRLGFEPVIMNIKQFVAEMESGDIDGQDNPLTNIYQFDIHKHHRYITLTGHILGVCGLYVNRGLYEGWPDEVRQAVDDAALEATRTQRALAIEEDVELLKKFDPAENDIIQLSDEKRQAFVDAVTPIIDEQRKIIGDELVDLAMS